jgi:hypothetical protein
VFLAFDEEITMRTTLAIDDSVLASVRRVALRRRQSLGAVVSELLRQALVAKTSLPAVGGLPLMPVQPGAGQADLKIVNTLRDELE